MSAAFQELLDGLPCGKLSVKIAANEEERRRVFKLRYKVFNEELGEGIAENAATGLDQDEFDQYCDHLMVLSKDEVVGTYRLLYGPKRPKAGFYTETEFDLRDLQINFEQCVELGRGCIEPAFRKQTTLLCLFWGLHRYMLARRARYLMGCASLPLMGPNDAEATFDDLMSKGHIDTESDVGPWPKNNFKGIGKNGTPQIPQLISFYLEFGAKILGRPAFDPIFKCYDLLMCFDMDHLSKWGTELLMRFDKRLISDINSDE